MISLIDPALEQYAISHSSKPEVLLQQLAEHTKLRSKTPQMLIGPLEGMLLRFLIRSSKARRLLEIGTFTGYSALTMALELPQDGELISCEISPTRAAIAQSFFDRSDCHDQISIMVGDARQSIKQLSGKFDLIFIDADKENYLNYYQATLPLLAENGLMVVDNVLWSGAVLDPQQTSDCAIVEFNTAVAADPTVEQVMLSVRDGMLLIRRRSTIET